MTSKNEQSPRNICDWMIRSAQIQRTTYGRLVILQRINSREETVLDFGTSESLSALGRAMFYLHCEYIGLSDQDEQDRALTELEASVRRVG